MSDSTEALNNVLREQLRKASEQSRRQPVWSKRLMPAIRASFAKANASVIGQGTGERNGGDLR